jgi:uncharacterized protein
MRPACALWVYLFFVFIGAALVSPWVHQGLVASGWTGIPFRRVVDRCLIALAVLGLWPFVKALGVRSCEELGLKKYPQLGGDLAIGLAVGSALLLIAATVSIAVGASHWVPRGGWPKQIGSALASATAVAILEEVLFRGAIYTALARVWGPAAGLGVSSALYGILHFFGRPEDPDVIDWKAGFTMLGRMLSGFVDFQQVVPGFFSLTLLGVILAIAFRRTGALFMSMGLHAGIVFWNKLYAFATDTTPNANTWFWGTEKLVDGWFCFTLLVIATICFTKVSSPRK